MINALVPELAVTDWTASRAFYCDVLGFACAYERPEEGFSFLTLGQAQLMIDQIGKTRSWHSQGVPLGAGVNLQIMVPSLAPLLEAATQAGCDITVGPETRRYRRSGGHVTQRQFVVADPDGYLLRFAEAFEAA